MQSIGNAPLSKLLRSTLVLFCLIVTLIHHSDVLTLDPLQIHFPLPGLDFFGNPFVLFVLGWSAVIFSFAAVFDRQTERTLLMAGMISFLFSIGTTEGRLAFAFFQSLALIALGIQQYCPARFRAIVVFVSSVYLTAAAHKLEYFWNMVSWLPVALRSVFSPGFVREFPGCAEFLSTAMSSIIIC